MSWAHCSSSKGSRNRLKALRVFGSRVCFGSNIGSSSPDGSFLRAGSVVLAHGRSTSSKALAISASFAPDSVRNTRMRPCNSSLSRLRGHWPWFSNWATVAPLRPSDSAKAD
ncbi:hypothetical protein D3C78_1587680 [compost metagenome]